MKTKVQYEPYTGRYYEVRKNGDLSQSSTPEALLDVVFPNGWEIVPPQKAGVSSQRDLDVCERISNNEWEMANECSHSWQAYCGLTETYDFCTKCDEKRKP